MVKGREAQTLLEEITLIKVKNVSQEIISIINLNHSMIVIFYPYSVILGAVFFTVMLSVVMLGSVFFECLGAFA